MTKKEKATPKTTDDKELKVVDGVKTTKEPKVEDKEQREDVVGTAANPKPPEAGSVGMDDGGKKVVDDLSKENTNVRDGAGIADGNERIGLNDGTVGTREDLEPGSTIIGEAGTVNGSSAEDREPAPLDPDSVKAGELNPSPTTDPVINGLYDALQAPAHRVRESDADGAPILDDRAGFDYADPRYEGIPITQLTAVKACVMRVEKARELGHNESAERALKDLSEALGPLDGGSSNLRTWAGEQREEINKDLEKQYRKDQRDAKKDQQ